MTIWKYKLPTRGVISVTVPIGASPLTAQYQRSEEAAFLWMQVDPTAPTWRRHIAICLTGGKTPPSETFSYVSTVQYESVFVAHVFVENEPVAPA